MFFWVYTVFLLLHLCFLHFIESKTCSLQSSSVRTSACLPIRCSVSGLWTAAGTKPLVTSCALKHSEMFAACLRGEDQPPLHVERLRRARTCWAVNTQPAALKEVNTSSLCSERQSFCKVSKKLLHQYSTSTQRQGKHVELVSHFCGVFFENYWSYWQHPKTKNNNL